METQRRESWLAPVATAAVSAFLCSCASQRAPEKPQEFVLVSPEEYTRALGGFSSPQAAIGVVRGGSSDPSGPAIEVVQPSLNGKPISNPIALDVRWRPADGAKVDLKSLKIIYAVGNTREDKTGLLRTYCKWSRSCELNQSGLAIVALPSVAPGMARFEVELADTMGRKTYKDIVVTVQ